MSVVTNAILHLPCLEDGKFEKLNKIIKSVNCNEEGFGPRVDVENCTFGGRKNMEANLYLAAFNNVNTADLVDAIKSIEWDDFNEVQLFIKEQHDDILTERLHKSDVI